MVNELSIEVEELRQCIAILLDHLEAQGPVIHIPQEYYWAIDGNARYDTGCEPSELSIGCLSDDLHQIRRLKRDDANEPVLQHLVWLGAILTSIGERPVYRRNAT